MVHQREYRGRLENIWFLVMDSWKTYLAISLLSVLITTNDSLVDSRLWEEYS